jgi:hypothetical protein
MEGVTPYLADKGICGYTKLPPLPIQNSLTMPSKVSFYLLFSLSIKYLLKLDTFVVVKTITVQCSMNWANSRALICHL